jgi:hypothetical protein
MISNYFSPISFSSHNLNNPDDFKKKASTHLKLKDAGAQQNTVGNGLDFMQKRYAERGDLKNAQEVGLRKLIHRVRGAINHARLTGDEDLSDRITSGLSDAIENDRF